MNRVLYATVRRVGVGGPQEVEVLEVALNFEGLAIGGPVFAFPIWYGPETREPEIGERLPTREHDGKRYVVAPPILGRREETTQPVKLPCPHCGQEITITVVTRGSGGGT